MENERPTIFYDGYCNLCNGALKLVIKRDRDHLFRYIPIQSDQGAKLLTALPTDKQAGDSIVYIDGEKIYLRSTAILKILFRLGRIWHVLMIFMIVPERYRDKIYNWIARNRVRWFGRSRVCMLVDDTDGDETPD